MGERLPCVYDLAGGYRGTLYTGVTSSLLARVIQHRDGTFDGFTGRYGVERLVHDEIGETMEAMIAREKQMSDVVASGMQSDRAAKPDVERLGG